MHEPKLNKFAVIGNPVEHSKSPIIHQCFAKQFGITLSYDKILATKDNFSDVVMRFFSEGGTGLNITTPFKSAAAELVNRCSVEAKQCQSVNTVSIDSSGLLVGNSTDGVGWLRDIKRNNTRLNNSNVLVIGAGGAGRMIINQLGNEALGSLHVCNRTVSKVRQLENEITTVSSLTDIPDRHWDLMINTLPVGWHGKFPEINVTPAGNTRAYDLNYGDGAAAFLRWYLDKGGQQDLFMNGWGMLVEQAAESFNIWLNLVPDTTQLILDGVPNTV